MDTIIQALTPPVLFIVGLIVRALLAILVLAAIVVPIAAVLMAATGIMRAIDRMTGVQKVGHVRWRSGCYYTPGHLWLRARGDQAVRIGVDDVGQRVLPEIAQVSLPAEGEALARGAGHRQHHVRRWHGRVAGAGGRHGRGRQSPPRQDPLAAASRSVPPRVARRDAARGA